MTKHSHRSQLYIIFMVVAIGFMGVALPYPILSPMILTPSCPCIVPSFIPEHFRPIILGIVLATYPLGQFFGSPILGGLSDIHGRKKTLMYALCGTMIGYTLSAIAIEINSLSLLIISRFATGICEGNIAIAQSSAADLSNRVSKVTSFGLVYNAAAIGYVVGPILGGVLSDSSLLPGLNFSFPFFAAAGLTLVAILLVAYRFQETNLNPTKQSVHIFKILAFGYDNIRTTFRSPPIRKNLIIAMTYFAGLDFFYQYYPLYGVGRWDLTPFNLAMLTTSCALPYSLAQTFIVPKLQHLFTPKRLLIISTLNATILISLILLVNHIYLLYGLFCIIAIHIAIISTYISVLVSDSAPENIQGKVMGVSQSVRVFNDAVIALTGGGLATLFLGAPLLASSTLILITCILLLKKA